MYKDQLFKIGLGYTYTYLFYFVVFLWYVADRHCKNLQVRPISIMGNANESIGTENTTTTSSKQHSIDLCACSMGCATCDCTSVLMVLITDGIMRVDTYL